MSQVVEEPPRTQASVIICKRRRARSHVPGGVAIEALPSRMMRRWPARSSSKRLTRSARVFM
jgi:hypothetical protein